MGISDSQLDSANKIAFPTDETFSSKSSTSSLMTSWISGTEDKHDHRALIHFLALIFFGFLAGGDDAFEFDLFDDSLSRGGSAT